MASGDWRTIESAEDLTDVFTQEGAENAWRLYQEAKAQYRAYKAAKDKFEAEMQAGFELTEMLPADSELKFGYNFGKLSIAVGPKVERKVKATKPAGGLGDWIKAQASSGRRF